MPKRGAFMVLLPVWASGHVSAGPVAVLRGEFAALQPGQIVLVEVFKGSRLRHRRRRFS